MKILCEYKTWFGNKMFPHFTFYCGTRTNPNSTAPNIFVDAKLGMEPQAGLFDINAPFHYNF